MFNDNFFPTPTEVIELMIAPHVFEITEWRRYGNVPGRYLSKIDKILEPSIGKCDIADYLVEQFGVKRKDISCCELDENLSLIAAGKGYRLLERDFLKLNDPYPFDLIIMNPPFDNGAAHVLKAWEVLETCGGHIVSQVNAETIRNPYTFERKKLLGLIETFGSVEFIGQAYRKAERPSDVEVAIVRLQRPAAKQTVDWGLPGDYERDSKPEDVENFADNTPVSSNAIAQLVARYNAAKAAVEEQWKVEQKFNFYVSGVKNAEIMPAVSITDSVDRLKKAFWSYIFDKTHFADVTTSKVREEFEKFVTGVGNMAFTEENIVHILRLLMRNSQSTMMECLVQTFDRMLAYDKENKIHWEGWLTNDAYKVNKKVILPIRMFRWDNWSSWMESNSQNIVDDIDKALCFVAGRKFTEITPMSEVISKACGQIGYGSSANPGVIESTFFRIRIYKKGTIHLQFLDEDLWMKFNVTAAQGKNWIGAEAAEKYQKRQKKSSKKQSQR